MSDLPNYVYVASSWRNPMQEAVCATLKAAGIDHYDFKNPEGGTGFSWAEVKDATSDPSIVVCQGCGEPIIYSTYAGMGLWEPDYDPDNDPEKWRHKNGYAGSFGDGHFAVPKKGSDWESVTDYLAMVNHPRAIEGYEADFGAMNTADTFVLVLPCGKSAHLELGWAVGWGKRTAILCENPMEPELMYRMVDHISPNMMDLLGWLGVED